MDIFACSIVLSVSVKRNLFNKLVYTKFKLTGSTVFKITIVSEKQNGGFTDNDGDLDVKNAIL